MTFIISGCDTVSFVVYKTYLKDSTIDSLHYNDSRFSFDFLPVANSIYFKITNLLDTTAFLIWDKSYFIEPDGNSYNALNTDLLQENETVANKEDNKSIIPQHGTLLRFTTSATNYKKFTAYTTQTVNNLYYNFSISNMSSNSFYTIGNYWPETIENLNSQPHDISNYVINNNNLGLGLTIRVNDETCEYKFDFKIKELRIYSFYSDINNNKETKLIAVAKLPDLSNWEVINQTVK